MGEVELRNLKRLGKFQTSSGLRYRRYAGFRDAVVPRWPKMFKPAPISPRNRVEKARKVVKRARRVIGHYYDGCIENILEIGCSRGTYTYALAELGARRIDALDIKLSLDEVRRLVGRRYRKTSCEINFYCADVADWKKKDIYDLVISWQTLEHITRWEEAFESMYDALRLGGLCYHEYEPFFGWEGGHSLCTLDFPYGHVLLSASDFERYIKRHRPDECEVAVDFYRNGLNRMTLADLRRCVDRIGFETLILSVHRRKGKRFVTRSVLAECQVNYPTLTIDDLVAHNVRVLLRKP